jgi:hypothetical protein
MSMVLYILVGVKFVAPTEADIPKFHSIYTQRGLRHCLSSVGRQYQSLSSGMSDEFRFPRFFYVFLCETLKSVQGICGYLKIL